MITYVGRSVNTVSIMEFQAGKVVRETQYFAEPFEPRRGEPSGWNGWRESASEEAAAGRHMGEVRGVLPR